MGLESATFLNDLVATNPAAGDVVSQGDDHLRLLKAVLKATFPNLTAAVDLTPSGVIQHGTIELGHATDTTLSRAAAGAIAVEGSRVYQRNNILGTVSQSAGVPTGGVIETGSNANGRYIRFADGTQICFRTNATFSFEAGNSILLTWTFPIAFVDSTYSLSGSSSGSSGDRTDVGRGSEASFEHESLTTSSCALRFRNPASNWPATAEIRNCKVTAIGRWF